MRIGNWGVVALSACLALGACKIPGLGGDKTPTGQVVATVDGQEITLRDLQNEMGGATFPDPKARRAAEIRVLDNIIGRTVLADAARKQGLEKTPQFAINKKRALDALLVQTLEQKIVSSVPQPTKDEAESFVAAHPDIFAERKIFSVDQIRMPRPSDPAVLKALVPLKTMEEIESLLKADNIPYQRVATSLDSVGTDPRLLDAINKLAANEVFVIPGGDGLLVNVIRDSKTTPFTGPAAVDYARNLIARQRSQESAARAFNDILAKARETVKFNKDYQPTAADAAPGAKAVAGEAAQKP